MQPNMPTCDAELIRRICRRDVDAFEAFAARHRDAVRRHIAGIVRDEATADDVLQECLLRVWTRADQWDGSGAPKAWLYRIATNLALNQRRTITRRRETAIDELAADAAGSTARALQERLTQPGLDRLFEEGDRSTRLRRMIGALPAAKRDAAQLAWEEELELRVVAERLDIPEGTVKSRLYHARKLLARQWFADGNEGEDQP